MGGTGHQLSGELRPECRILRNVRAALHRAIQQGPGQGVVARRRVHDQATRVVPDHRRLPSWQEANRGTDRGRPGGFRQAPGHSWASIINPQPLRTAHTGDEPLGGQEGYRTSPLVHEDPDVVRRRKETQRQRRLEPGEEEKLLAAAEPHLRAVIIAALETCCRQGELLGLRWVDISLARGEIILRAEHTKDREKRVIPISSLLREELESRRYDSDGQLLPPMAYVFGDEIGRRIGSIRRAWQTAVLRAHGHQPVWIWKKKGGPNDKGSTRLSPESEATYRAIDLRFHDLRHEAGSRLLEPGGRSITCSTCSAMRHFSRPARTSTRRSGDYMSRCGRSSNLGNLASPLPASLPAVSGLLANRLPPPTGTP